jgi:hypothetical protein
VFAVVDAKNGDTGLSLVLEKPAQK